MGYAHIENLYKNREIIQFKECYALEKIHGTSAHVSFIDGELKFFSGGEKYESFIKLFDSDKLKKIYKENFIDDDVRIHGEAYGGKCQGMSLTYGDSLKFVAFDVNINDKWVSTPVAEDVVVKLFDLEFVHYKKIKAEVDEINAERDADSQQAIRNGLGTGHKREGVVLRPLIEVTKNNGQRIVAKHKRDEFRETKSPRMITDEELKILANSKQIAKEWVTLERLKHVLDKFPKPYDITLTGQVIKAMHEDVIREAKGEIIECKEVSKEINRLTAMMYKKYLQSTIEREN